MQEKIISPNKSASRAGLLLFMLPVAVVCCHMTPAHSNATGQVVATVNKIVSNEIVYRTALFTNCGLKAEYHNLR